MAAAAIAAVLVLLGVAAPHAGAHGDGCFSERIEEEGGTTWSQPDGAGPYCDTYHHNHDTRDAIVKGATSFAVLSLLSGLIITPEALRQTKTPSEDLRHENPADRGRWQSFVPRLPRYGAMPRRYWLTYWCATLLALLVAPIAAQLLLWSAFADISNTTATLYVFVCVLSTAIGSFMLMRKWRESRETASRLTLDGASAAGPWGLPHRGR